MSIEGVQVVLVVVHDPVQPGEAPKLHLDDGVEAAEYITLFKIVVGLPQTKEGIQFERLRGHHPKRSALFIHYCPACDGHHRSYSYLQLVAHAGQHEKLTWHWSKVGHRW